MHYNTRMQSTIIDLSNVEQLLMLFDGIEIDGIDTREHYKSTHTSVLYL